jgi:HSP20 family protein
MNKNLAQKGSGQPRPRWGNPLSSFLRSDFPDFWSRDIGDTVPALNISEEKNNYKVELAAPGLKKEDFKIDVERNVITISSEKETETNEGAEGSNYSCRENNYINQSISKLTNISTNQFIDR